LDFENKKREKVILLLRGWKLQETTTVQKAEGAKVS
jgi:hypothetical protein